MTARPWMKFFSTDWRQAPDLASCSYAAKGLWIDTLCLMHQSPRRGYLLATNGKPIDVASLARLTCGVLAEVEILLAELEQAGVFSRVDGAIVCRRMVREEEKRLQNQTNGAKGGNPLLTKGIPSDNPPDNPMDKRDTHGIGYAPSGVVASGSVVSVPVNHTLETTAPNQGLDERLIELTGIGIAFGIAQKLIRDHNTPLDLIRQYCEMASGDNVKNRAAFVRAAIAGSYAPRQAGSNGKQREEADRAEQDEACRLGREDAARRIAAREARKATNQ